MPEGRPLAWLAAALLLVAGCRVEEHGSRDSARAAEAAATDDVNRAVRIARALRADRERSEAEVLAEHGMTQQELGDLLFRIAADSASAARYRALLESSPVEASSPRPR